MASRPVLLLAAGLFAGQPAAAQILSGGDGKLFRPDAAGTRPEPDFAPRPYIFGRWALNLSATARTRFDSNVLNSPDDPNGDQVVVGQPALSLRSLGATNGLGLDASARLTRFRDNPRQDSDEWALGGFGRLDFTDGSQMTGRLGLARSVERRGDSGPNPLLAGQPAFRLLEASLAGQTALGPLTLDTRFAATRQSFAALPLAGARRLDQSFRDQRQATASTRLRWRFSPNAEAFVRTTIGGVKSLEPRPGLARDAVDSFLLGGVRADLNSLFVAEVGAGWRGRDFANPAFRDFSGLTYDATLDWYPTPLLSLRAQAGQDFRNSGFVDEPGILQRQLSLAGYWDPLRNLRVSATIEHQRDRYRQRRVTARLTRLEVEADYRFGPRLGAQIFAAQVLRRSSDTAIVNGYDRTLFGVGLSYAL